MTENLVIVIDVAEEDDAAGLLLTDEGCHPAKATVLRLADGLGMFENVGDDGSEQLIGGKSAQTFR